VELGELSISGNNEWINVVFEFIPTQDYNVIVIGPGCARNPNFRDDPYFYFDRITLAERADFEIPFSNVEGGLCDDQIILSVEADDSFTYQWYHDGVAILGAVDPLFNLSTSDDFGEYNVLITTSSGCFLSESFELENGSTFSYDLVEICEGEQYVFGEDTLLISGTYQDIIPISVICDSVIEIDFIVHPNEYFEIFDTICEGDTYTYANLSEMQSGDYIVEDQTQFGCLSETLIHLTVLEGIQNLELQTSVAIDLGESIVLEPIAYSSDIVSFEWSDENNIVLSNEIQYGPFLPLGPSIFYLTGTDKDGCSLTRSIEVEVEQNVEIFIPNIFYPKDILGNDKFKIGYTPAVKSIDIQIFDRWGNPVYNFEGAIENYEGWDGRYNNSNYVEQGVYTYLIKFELINSDVKIFAGDLTLIK
ncbi:MAG: hypothetical protein HKO66_01485, partial [Saprospiraceae bacterium]|nr:hypothetical protein [Saprospiraceae bacterium]